MSATMAGLLLIMTLFAGLHPADSLPPCPDTPNCVSTGGDHPMAPFRYRGSSEEAMKRLKFVLRSMPRTKIVAESATMIRVEFTTRVFRFIDDALFVVDDSTKTIHFRSASRVGRNDFGVNRRRMEDLREKFESR